MRVRFDRTVRMMYIEFAEGASVLTVEEEAELILSPSSRLLALRLKLSNVGREMPDTPMRAVVAPCVASGWRLSENEGAPTLYGEVRAVKGPTSTFNWQANVDLDVTGKRIVGVEIDLGGNAAFIKP